MGCSNFAKSLRFSVIVACGMGLFSAPVRADVVQATINGTFLPAATDGSGTYFSAQIDSYGTYTGVAGTHLSGLTFVETLSYNTPFSETEPFGQGNPYSVGTNSISISLTVQGYATQLFNNGPGQFSEAGYTGFSQFQFDDGFRENLFTASPYVALSLETQTGLNAYLAGLASYTDRINAVDNFSNTYFDVTSASGVAVPEPSTMAILAAGLVGIGLRRRRAK